MLDEWKAGTITELWPEDPFAASYTYISSFDNRPYAIELEGTTPAVAENQLSWLGCFHDRVAVLGRQLGVACVREGRQPLRLGPGCMSGTRHLRIVLLPQSWPYFGPL